ncbi:MAG: cyclase family protein [Armatimonadota bacterium]|nr:cyclase family protein [Armatimonadota bacterium]
MPIFHDITIPISADTPIWPGDPPTEITAVSLIANGEGCNVSKLCFSSHAGTHIDAPRHFIPSGKTVDELSLEALIGPAWVAEFPVEDMIDAPDLEAANIPPDMRRLLLKTRNSNLWSKQSKGLETDFAAITPSAAKWLVERRIRLVGIDYISIEHFESSQEPVHKLLLENEIIIIENLNLSDIAPGRYHLICLPLLIKSDGAPARVVLVEE